MTKKIVFILLLLDHVKEQLFLEHFNNWIFSLSWPFGFAMFWARFVLPLKNESFSATFERKFIHNFHQFGGAQSRAKGSHFEFGRIMIDGVDLWSSFVPLKNDIKRQNVKAYYKPFVNISILNPTNCKLSKKNLQYAYNNNILVQRN